MRNGAGIADAITLRSVANRLVKLAAVGFAPSFVRSAASTMGAASVVRPDDALALAPVALATAEIIDPALSPKTRPMNLLPITFAGDVGTPPPRKPAVLENMPASGVTEPMRLATWAMALASPDFAIRPPSMLVEAAAKVDVAVASDNPSVEVADWIIAGVARS